ncbi:MAG: hypothetical protein L0191_19355 [Acidobacteria bacterium]|nr:hypothetical protein [Acidobacteriota bacterium]
MAAERKIAARMETRDTGSMLPRHVGLVELFTHCMADDAKAVDGDEETGIKKYRYIRTGENHFSMAYTYAWMTVTEMKGWWFYWLNARKTGRYIV